MDAMIAVGTIRLMMRPSMTISLPIWAWLLLMIGTVSLSACLGLMIGCCCRVAGGARKPPKRHD